MSFRLSLAVASALLAVAAPAAAKPKLAVGQPAPAFEAVTLEQQPFSLAAMKGQVVVLNYWATWCAPCKAEMPMLHRFYERHRQAGFAMIGITTEDSVPARMLKKLDGALAYPLATRAKGKPYAAIRSVPTSYVIDRRGVLRHIEVGAFDEAGFNAVILPLLAERAQ